MPPPTTTIDPDIQAIERALAERGIPQAELGRRLGLDSSQVTRMFQGRRRLQRHEMATVREWLWPESGPLPPGGHVVPMPGMVPLYGWGVGNDEHRLTLSQQSIRAYVPMHPGQQGTVDPFALEVADVGMSPRYEPGEIAYVAPNRWPTRGQDCVVVTLEGEGFLGRFLHRDALAVFVHRLHPPADQQFRLTDVKAIHAVVGRG